VEIFKFSKNVFKKVLKEFKNQKKVRFLKKFKKLKKLKS
jgi:hypothetical protein